MLIQSRREHNLLMLLTMLLKTSLPISKTISRRPSRRKTRHLSHLKIKAVIRNYQVRLWRLVN